MTARPVTGGTREPGDQLREAMWKLHVADAVLTPSDVAELIAAKAAVQRVRSTADVLQRAAELSQTMRLNERYYAARGDGLAQATQLLRRALDGGQP